MSSKLKVTGELRITALRINRLLSSEELALAILRGLAFPVVKAENLIVWQGLTALTALLGGGSGSPVVGGDTMDEATVRDLAVVQMLVTKQTSPSAPVGFDTGLEGSTEWEFHTKYAGGAGPGDSLLTVSYPNPLQVKFSGLIPQPDKGDETFTEEGLFSNNSKLIARTTFSKLKTTAFALQFDHTITLTG